METHLGGLALVPHPATPPSAVPGVHFSFVWHDAGSFSFDFIVPVKPAALKLPEPAAPERTDGLWQTSCFELFLKDPESDYYREFNFSPSGRWAAYAFNGYRAAMRDFDMAAPRVLTADPAQFDLSMEARLREIGMDEVSVRQMLDASQPMSQPQQFALSALVDDASLNEGRRWLAGVTAVIEEADGTKSYWALHHPRDEPDFHNEAGFVLELG